MPPPVTSYFVRGEDGEEYGPVDLAELREWVAENRAGVGTEVKRDEPDGTWQPWQHFPELVALLAAVNATAGGPDLSFAPLWRRAVAFMLDIILISMLATPIFIVLAVIFIPDWTHQYWLAAQNPPFVMPELPGASEIFVNLIGDMVLVLYFSLFQWLHGQTPAKQLFRVRVVDQAGQKPSFPQTFWRAVALLISMNLLFLPMLYAFFNPQRRTLHDMIAGTYVVEA